jgi:cell division protein FtsI/penicillin-binding protein 2
MLHELRRYGLSGISLAPDADDTEWGQVLSLGEDRAVTPKQVSAFMRNIGVGGAGLFSEQTALRLRTALEGVVQRGTADTIKNALSGTGWRIGGKTGTGPGQCGDHCDGWFASLLSDKDKSRYVILVFIQGQGLGSGVAAHAAAAIAEYLVEQDRPRQR